MNRRIVTAMVAVITLSGCAEGVNPASPSLPAVSTPAPVPQPGPGASIPTSTLSGTIFQATEDGRRPVAGVLVEIYSCPTSERCRTNVIRRSTTDNEGAYYLPELYGGSDNYIWITKEGYEPEGNPPKPACDFCNFIVTVGDETRLDIALVRR